VAFFGSVLPAAWSSMIALGARIWGASEALLWPVQVNEQH
jgi:hypothetical protein